MNKTSWVFINLIGGIAVIGSYFYGFLTYPNATNVLWGGVPARLHPLYTACMFVAAIGYLTLAYFVGRLDAHQTTVLGRFGFGLFNILYTLVLVPSAIWMSLTLFAIEHTSVLSIWLVRFDLILVAIGSLGLLIAVLTTRPRMSTSSFILAMVGSAALCFQTVILDAMVWSFFFHG